MTVRFGRRIGGVMSRSSLLAVAAVIAAVGLSGCGRGQQQAGGPPPPGVTVAKPTQQTVTDRDEYVGRFVAKDSVEVRARVSGYLDKIHFTDGQMVKQGDLLFSIDKRALQNTLDQARGALAQARANLAFAETDLQRGSQLVRDSTITQQTYDQRTQAKRVAEASVAAQEAAVAQAALDVEFSELRAPVTGRIGDRRVSPGNLVTGGTTGNTTLLATINSIDPIRFEFTFDEASYLRYERAARNGKDITSRNGSVAVKLKLIDEKDFVHEGRMDFVDNAIDRSTGTIRGRAEFSNPNGVFTPGMFGRVQVPGSAPYTALLVPDVAIGSDQARKFVFVIGADNTAQQKYVELGQLVGPLRVIKSGLNADDTVIVNGVARIRPGQKVTPQQEGQKGPAPAASAAPAQGAAAPAKAN
jgi:RND family efflux transporter MFP subunit